MSNNFEKPTTKLKTERHTIAKANSILVDIMYSMLKNFPKQNSEEKKEAKTSAWPATSFI